MPPLLWCDLRVTVIWLRRSQAGEPRGAWARVVGWPVPVSGAGAVTPCLQGALWGSCLPGPCRVAGRLRVPLAACPRRSVSQQRNGRRLSEGGGGRAGRTVCCLVGACVDRCLSRSLGLLDRRRGSAADVVCWAGGSLGPPRPLCVPSWKTTRRAAGGGVRLQR